MKLLFIRHSIALEREEFDDDDLLRPLSLKGREVAEEFFSKLPKIYKEIDLIVSSKAIRALQTADILRKSYPNTEYKNTPLLNPSANIKDLRKFLDSCQEKYKCIALVGHEPDFSLMISYIVTCGKGDVMLKLKKPSLVEIDLFDEAQLAGELRNHISPKILKKC